MDQRNKVIIFGGVGLLVLAVILVSLFYFLKFSKVSINKNVTPTVNVPNSLSRLPSVAITPAITNATNPITANNKIFQGQGFTLSFPSNWGILTCGNSNNFEFDPNGGDLRNVMCDRALKPVTVLVSNQLSCNGDQIKLGNNSVTKTKTINAGGDISYQWCTVVGNISFDITHRVSANGARATSKDDLSTLVEKIIASLSINR